MKNNFFKRRPYFLLPFIGLIICSSAYIKCIYAIPNPAAVYCEKMGYPYSTEKDSAGNVHGVCTLPDGSKVDGWDFFRGKKGTKYNYCAKKGYKTEVQREYRGQDYTECAVCVIQNAADNTVERVKIEDLMKSSL
ncbi:MAG TPA: hypothetical protein DCO75_04335 [Fibrobacteres bacterium]|jgi:putative hemolysin|nr:hypothetical protein [Fibrobacterota bacterium]